MLKRFGLLLLAAVFAYIGLFYGLLRFLQEKDSGMVFYIAQDIVFILCGLVGVFACSRALVRMRKEKAALIAAQPLPEVISAGLSVKSRIVAALLMIMTGTSAYAALTYPPALKGVSVLLLITLLLGLLTYTFWIQYDRDGETLRLDRTGIKHIWYGMIPWNQIVGMHIQAVDSNVMKQRIFHLGVPNRHKYLANAPWFVRWKQGAGMLPSSRMSIHMPLHPLNVDSDLIERVAFKQRGLHQPPMASGWNYSMTEEEFKQLSDANEISQRLHHELQAFEEKFIKGGVLTESEIADGNKQMERLLSEHSKLISEGLELRSQKFGAIAKNIYLVLGIFTTFIFVMVYFTWRSNPVFGIILFVAMAVWAVDVLVKIIRLRSQAKKKVP